MFITFTEVPRVSKLQKQGCHWSSSPIVQEDLNIVDLLYLQTGNSGIFRWTVKERGGHWSFSPSDCQWTVRSLYFRHRLWAPCIVRLWRVDSATTAIKFRGNHLRLRISTDFVTLVRRIVSDISWRLWAKRVSSRQGKL